VRNATPDTSVRYDTESVDGLEIFFSEARNPSRRAVMLLRGFPASSHMYPNVLSRLSDLYHHAENLSRADTWIHRLYGNSCADD
jgi:hypothetical protein